jgi:hypothetical protein
MSKECGAGVMEIGENPTGGELGKDQAGPHPVNSR